MYERCRYEVNSEGAQADLPLHQDGSLVSFNVLLNPPPEFDGGGTHHIQQGSCLIHSGQLLHAGCRITRGRRLVLVGFVDVAEPSSSGTVGVGATMGGPVPAGDDGFDEAGQAARFQAAVDEWLDGAQRFHLMHEHMHDPSEVLGGMWVQYARRATVARRVGTSRRASSSGGVRLGAAPGAASAGLSELHRPPRLRVSLT